MQIDHRHLIKPYDFIELLLDFLFCTKGYKQQNERKKSIQMILPICGFDAKNAILCPQCESKVESGRLTKADVDASFILAKLAKENPQIDSFSLNRCNEVDGNYVIYLDKNDILAIRQSRTLYRLIQDQFSRQDMACRIRRKVIKNS